MFILFKLTVEATPCACPFPAITSKKQKSNFKNQNSLYYSPLIKSLSASGGGLGPVCRSFSAGRIILHYLNK